MLTGLLNQESWAKEVMEGAKAGNGDQQRKRCWGWGWSEFVAFIESRNVLASADGAVHGAGDNGHELTPCLYGTPLYDRLVQLQKEMVKLGIGRGSQTEGEDTDIGDLRSRWAALTAGTEAEEDESAAFHADEETGRGREDKVKGKATYMDMIY